ncbi:MAG: BMP family ABC transporter substrate-binding protein, partial [Eubacteriales bacterium]|nr:BMP family ABC transporter substrate-binding protein [Eubacteriales bacterium]
MKKIIALLAVLTMVFALAACAAPAATTAPAATATEAPAAEATEAPAADATEAPALKIGVILVGDENEGYTYAHIDGIKKAIEALGISADSVIWKYSIPEDETCYDTAVDLAEQGCTIIFSNSYSHQSYMVQAAEEYPDVIFCPATGDTAAVCGLPNVVNFFPYTYESRYVSGVVAGMKLKELMDAGKVSDPYIGYVGAYPYAEVVSGYTAFFLGIKSIVPEAHMDVVYTNSWFDMTKEAEAANNLMSRGCVIIGQHADSTGAPSAVQAKLDAGEVVYSVGYNVDMLSVAPTAALTSAQNNWSVLYKDILSDFMSGATMKHDYSGGYNEDAVQISALGESCAAGTAEKVAEVIAGLKAGTLHVFDTSTFTVGDAAVTTAPFDFSTMNAEYTAVQYQGPTEECIVDG